MSVDVFVSVDAAVGQSDANWTTFPRLEEEQRKVKSSQASLLVPTGSLEPLQPTQKTNKKQRNLGKYNNSSNKN